VGEMGVSSVDASSLTSASCSSVSSILGTMSPGLTRESRRESRYESWYESWYESGAGNMLVSKLGVVREESLADDMEGCGEELVLIRV
jgi:hypothetical protein